MFRTDKMSVNLEIGVVQARIVENLSGWIVGAEQHPLIFGSFDEDLAVLLNQFAAKRSARRRGIGCRKAGSSKNNRADDYQSH